MRKWEYTTKSSNGISSHQEWVETLNTLGSQGWELIFISSGNHYGTDYTVAYFKREIHVRNQDQV